MKKLNLKNIKLYNINYTKDFILLDEYNKIDLKTLEKFKDENKENLENFNKFIDIEYKLEYINNIKNEDLKLLKELEKNNNKLEKIIDKLENIKDDIKKKKTIEKLKEKKENLENKIDLLNIKIKNIKELKSSIKDLKEKKKILISENLENKYFNIYNLENFIKFLDENKYKIINNKKYIEL